MAAPHRKPIQGHRCRAQHKGRAALTLQNRQHKANGGNQQCLYPKGGRTWHAVVAKPWDTPCEAAPILHQRHFQTWTSAPSRQNAKPPKQSSPRRRGARLTSLLPSHIPWRSSSDFTLQDHTSTRIQDTEKQKQQLKGDDVTETNFKSDTFRKVVTSRMPPSACPRWTGLSPMGVTIARLSPKKPPTQLSGQDPRPPPTSPLPRHPTQTLLEGHQRADCHSSHKVASDATTSRAHRTRHHPAASTPLPQARVAAPPAGKPDDRQHTALTSHWARQDHHARGPQKSHKDPTNRWAVGTIGRRKNQSTRPHPAVAPALASADSTDQRPVMQPCRYLRCPRVRTASPRPPSSSLGHEVLPALNANRGCLPSPSWGPAWASRPAPLAAARRREGAGESGAAARVSPPEPPTRQSDAGPLLFSYS
jgi:hypothetical protein